MPFKPEALPEPPAFVPTEWFAAITNVAEPGTVETPETMREGQVLGDLLGEELPEPITDAPQDGGATQTAIPVPPQLPQFTPVGLDPMWQVSTPPTQHYPIPPSTG